VKTDTAVAAKLPKTVRVILPPLLEGGGGEVELMMAMLPDDGGANI
jgi:hypothetical protein